MSNNSGSNFLSPLRVALFGQSFFGDGSKFGESNPHRTSKHTAMASNALPGPLDKLFAKAARMITGLHDLEVPLEIKQNTEAVLTAALSAAQAADSAYDQAKVSRKAANAISTAKDGEGKVFIGNARTRFVRFFGEDASVEWEAAGWPPGSTAEGTRGSLCSTACSNAAAERVAGSNGRRPASSS